MTRVSPQDVPGQVPAPKQDEESYLLEEPLLDPFDDAPGDDAEAQELEVGVAIDELENGGENQEYGEIDLGEILSSPDDEPEDERDDAPIAIDLTQGLELGEAPLELGDEESVDEGPIALDEAKLPRLDRDDPSDGVALDAESLDLASADESSLPRAAEPWQLVAPAASLEACTSLASAGDHVVGASSDLLWFAGGAEAPLRLAVDHTSVASLILLGAEHELAIAATRGGKLWRRARQASQAVQLTRALDGGEAPAHRRRAWQLSLPSPEAPNEFWVHAGDGVLRRSVDAGEHFSQLELPGSVITLAPGAPVALLDCAGERCLAVRVARGFELRALSDAAALAARAQSPLLIAERERIALCAPQRAVLLSSDGGRSFRSVPGTANATALCFARFRERDRLWVAIYREATDQTLIALVDLERALAECVAVLKSDDADSGDPAERGEWGRVHALAWHAPSARLWAAGGFGLRSLNPLE